MLRCMDIAEPLRTSRIQPVALQRARGAVEASMRVAAGRTRIARLRQEGCLKLRFPRLPGSTAEIVLVNTAGGLAGGDALVQSITAEPGASLTITTQACERVYRSLGDDATAATRLVAGPDASLSYLPQETILFDGGSLSRRLDVDIADDARLLLCESVILGREAMGETVKSGRLHDRWRVRRAGQLVFADDLRIEGDIAAKTAGAASLGGGRAFATILACGAGYEARLPELREMLGRSGGASLVDGMLVARVVAPSGLDLRRLLVPALKHLAAGALPRLWSL